MPVRFIALSDSLYACVCLCICLATASTRLAAGISQSRDRTCCLSGRRVAIVILSASLRCFWETIPHQNQAVWVSATGHGSFFFFPAASLSVLFSSLVCSLLHPLIEHSQRTQAVIVDPILHCEIEKSGNLESLSTVQIHTHRHRPGMPKS